MEREQFEALVGRLEVFAKSAPRSYRFRVAFLALLGYAYVLLLLLGLLVLIGIIVGVLVATNGRGTALLAKAIIVPVVAIIFVVRGMWVRIPAPTGERLTAADAPELFSLLEDIRSKLQAARVHRVLVTGDFNASMAEVPRLGLLGWQRNYLVLGISLMEALSPAQFKAVIAHELAHLSKRHGRLSTWVYRVRAMWSTMADRLEQKPTFGGGAFRKFFHWYAPYFAAYSFVLARQAEYEADQLAAEIAGVAVSRDALLRMELAFRLLDEEFGPSLERLQQRSSAPPEHYSHLLIAAFRAKPPVDAAKRWLDEARNRRTNSADTHPALSQRLANICALDGSNPQVVGESVYALRGESAADRYLGALAKAIADRFDALWLADAKIHWESGHESLKRMEGRKAELRVNAASQSRTSEADFELACLTARTEGDDAALEAMRNVVHCDTNHAGARFELGRMLARRNDSACLEHLQQAMNLDVEFVMTAGAIALDFLDRNGRTAERGSILTKMDEASKVLEAASLERSNLRVQDRLRLHDLSADVVFAIARILSKHRDVGSAYLVEKEVRRLPHRRCYVLAAFFQPAFWKPVSANGAQRCANALAVDLAEFDMGVWVLDPQHKPLRKMIRQVQGSKIYDRRSWKKQVRQGHPPTSPEGVSKCVISRTRAPRAFQWPKGCAILMGPPVRHRWSEFDGYAQHGRAYFQAVHGPFLSASREAHGTRRNGTGWLWQVMQESVFDDHISSPSD